MRDLQMELYTIVFAAVLLAIVVSGLGGLVILVLVIASMGGGGTDV